MLQNEWPEDNVPGTPDYMPPLSEDHHFGLLIHALMHGTIPSTIRALRTKIKWEPQEAISTLVDQLSKAKEYTPGAGYLMGCLGEAWAYVDAPGRKMARDLAKLEMWADTKEHAILRGCMKLRAGDRAEAYAEFIKARETPGVWNFSSHRGAENIVLEDEPSWLSQRPRRRALMSPIRWLRDPVPAPMTAVFCGDVRYFCSFSKRVMASLAGSAAPVHFHVVGWNDEAEAVLSAFPERVTASTEAYAYPSDYTYFATVRFFRAVEFLRAMGPIYLSDLDGMFVKRPEDVQKVLRRHDAAVLKKMYHHRLPWLSPNAGHVFLNNTPSGLTLAQQMASYVDHRFMPGAGRNWYLDQLLLNEVLHHSEANVLAMTNATLPTQPMPHKESAAAKKHRLQAA